MSLLHRLYRSFKLALVLNLVYAWADINAAARKEPQLISYVERFVNEAQSRDVKINTDKLEISLVDKIEDVEPKGKGTPIGVCYRYGNSDKTKIELLKTAWKEFDETERWILVAHEMGHCQLNLEHRDDGWHIMNTYLLDARQYTTALLDELFNDYKKSN